MNFPILKGNLTTFPNEAVCPICRENKVLEPHSMAIFSGGALLMDRAEDSGGLSDDMDGFVNITWHGAHDNGIGKDRDIHTSVYAAEDCHGGQFEMYFCSTSCLRTFFNQWIDRLEESIQKQKLEQTDPSKR